MRLRRHLTTFQMMILGFALLILVGALVFNVARMQRGRQLDILS